MGKRIDIPKATLENMLYEECKSISAIANELGVHKGVVTRNMKEHGLKTRAEHQKDILTRDVLYQKYIVEEKSVKALHKELGCGRDWLRGRLAEYGLLRKADYDPSSDERDKLTYELLYREYIEERASIAEIARRHGYKAATVRRHLRKEGLFESKASCNGMNSSNMENQKISDDTEFIKLVNNGATVSELCSIYGCSSDTVYRKKEQLGLSNTQARKDIPKEDVIAMYVTDKLGIEEIAIRYGCSGGTIRNRLLEWGVELREPCELNRINFDEKAVRTALEQGMSYSAIAAMHDCAMTSVRNFAIKHGLDALSKSTISLEESKIMQMLDNHGVAYSIHDRKLLHGREIDILLDEHDIGMEVSPCFTHNSDIYSPHCGTPKDNDYHMSKALTAREANILLITKFDWMEPARLKHHVFNLMESEDRDKYKITLLEPFVRRVDDGNMKEEIFEKIAKHSVTFRKQNAKFSLEEILCFEAVSDDGETLMSVLLICDEKVNGLWNMFAVRHGATEPFDEIGTFQGIVAELYLIQEVNTICYMASLDFCEDVLLEQVGFEKTDMVEPYFRFVHKKGRGIMLVNDAVERFSDGMHLDESKVIEQANQAYWYRVFDCGYIMMERQCGEINN